MGAEALQSQEKVGQGLGRRRWGRGWAEKMGQGLGGRRWGRGWAGEDRGRGWAGGVRPRIYRGGSGWWPLQALMDFRAAVSVASCTETWVQASQARCSAHWPSGDVVQGPVEMGPRLSWPTLWRADPCQASQGWIWSPGFLTLVKGPFLPYCPCGGSRYPTSDPTASAQEPDVGSLALVLCCDLEHGVRDRACCFLSAGEGPWRGDGVHRDRAELS